LLAAANDSAKVGDAPRAAVLYELAKASGLPSSAATEVNAHLKAIVDFKAGTKPASAILNYGERAREALARATLEPSLLGDKEASSAVIDWISEAAAMDSDGSGAGLADRDNAIEAYQAVRGGAPMLIALGMMRGNSAFAIDELEAASLGRALPPGMRLRLEAAVGGNSREALLDLYRFFEAARKDEGNEVAFDKQLALGASFGTARALYEKSSGRLEDVMPLAMSLLDVGMPEVSATLISRSLRLDTPPEALAFSVGVILRAIMELTATGQIDAIASLYDETSHLREILLEPRNRPLLPIHERLVSMVANAEIQSARIDDALILLDGLKNTAGTPQTFFRLADLQAHRGKWTEAAASLGRAIAIAEKAGDVTSEAIGYEHLFLGDREREDWVNAEKHLGLALARALTARGVDLRGSARPGIERLVARIFEHYGEEQAVLRAFERALELSQGNPEEMTITVTDLARSALTLTSSKMSSLAAAQLDSDSIDRDQKIYVALWHKLTLQARAEKPDGLASGILLTTSPNSAWAGEIRKYAVNAQSVDELSARASTTAERSEAAFYSAFQSPTPSLDQLKKVARSDALDLVEVRIAKDRAAPRHAFKLPAGTVLP
jgi:tetratricopeptide (TPR) repeat protein